MVCSDCRRINNAYAATTLLPPEINKFVQEQWTTLLMIGGFNLVLVLTGLLKGSYAPILMIGGAVTAGLGAYGFISKQMNKTPSTLTKQPPTPSTLSKANYVYY